MRVVALEVTGGGGKLAAPVANARASWVERRGLILELRDASGRVGQGEASPLPGYSPDDLDGSRAALSSLEPDLLTLDEGAAVLPQLERSSSRLDSSQPAARFALECALLDLIGQALERPAWELIASAEGTSTETRPGAVGLTTLLAPADPPAVIEQALAARARGITTFKLKIGPSAALDAQLRMLRAVRDALGPDVALRVDANQSLPARGLHGVLDRLRMVSPQFVEEPTLELEALRDTPVPVALDESLQAPGATVRLAGWAKRLPVSTVVLKPMAIGGVARAVRLTEAARSLGLDVVISHLMDGPIALGAYVALALRASRPDFACGLDRHSGLSAWPQLELPWLASSCVTAWREPGLGVANLGETTR